MKVALSWSGGKDSAWALYQLLQSPGYEVETLFTVFDQQSEQVNLHGINYRLIEEQSNALGLPVRKVFTKPEDYNESLVLLFKDLKANGIEAIAFGDIFLEDLRSFRDKMLEQVGLEGIYPLWNSKSEDIPEGFLEAGFKSKICAADARYFSESELGQDLSLELLSDKPIDPCGENGEFHSLVYSGPIFKSKLNLKSGDRYFKEYQFRVETEQGFEMQNAKFWFQEFEFDR